MNKAGCAYILTPAGLETKARVTARFLRYKIVEYEKLQIEIETLRREVTRENSDKSSIFREAGKSKAERADAVESNRDWLPEESATG